MTDTHIESLYQEARSAIKARDYEYAIELLKRVLVVDENYKDTSRLLEKVIRLRKLRWYKNPRLWGALGLVVVFVLGIMIAPKIRGLFASPSANSTVRPSITIYTATPLSTPSPTVTPDPRTLNPANQHLYQYMEQGTSWHDARDVCASQGGYLASIQDAEENEFVYQLINGNTWLGATDEAKEGTWGWVSGEPWSYQNWEQGEPSNSNQSEPEHYLNFGSSSMWNDVPEGDNQFVCEWEPIGSAAITQAPTLDPALQIAFDAIQNEVPIYQISFDFSWDREFYNHEDAGTRIDDGKLILTGETQKENRGYLILPPAIHVSDMFAVEFEFRILESTPDGRCSLGNWGEGEGIGISFLPQGQVQLWRSGLGTGATSNFDVSKTNTFTLISFGERIAAFINGQFAAAISKPEGTNIYGERFFNATDVIVCEFDNYKIWDLSAVDFNP